MNNNPYDQNQQNIDSDNQQSLDSIPTTQDIPQGFAQDFTQNSENNYAPWTHVVSEPPPMNTLATVSMILGIISFSLFASYVCGVLAIIFGIVARRCGNRSGKSIAGIICGAASVVLTTILFLIFLVAINFNFNYGATELSIRIFSNLM